MHVLRLCSVFEPPPGALDGAAARFDPVGGMQNHTAALTDCLDELGVQQTVVTSRLGGPAGTTRRGTGTAVTRVGVRLRRFRQLWGPAAVLPVLRARHVDVVHAHQGEDLAVLLLGMAAAAVHRCPLVVTVHCSVAHTVTGRSPRDLLLRLVGGRIERRALRRAATVVALARRTADLLAGDGVDRQRLQVLPSGFSPALFGRYGDRPRDDVFPGLARPRVGYVGRLAAQKRPDLAVAAHARMTVDATLVVVGDGPFRARVEALVRRSAGQRRVHLTGFVPHDEVPDVLASLDVLVLPSAYEELGSVLVEAVATGLPVVGSCVGGIPEVVEDGVTGLLVPPLDVDALARALDRLAGDAALRGRMAVAARERALAFEWPTLAKQVLQVYEEAAQRPATTG